VKIAVVGLGKIGLPLAVQYATKRHQVVGVDVDPNVVSAVNAGKEPFPGEAGLAELLVDAVEAGHLTATLDYPTAVPEAEAVVVVVPLFVDIDGIPDFRLMDAATRDVAANLGPDTLVLYETTLPVGTTRTRWKPLLEQQSGMTEGIDFHVAFSPERVLTGRVFADLRKYPKVVGALSADGAGRATDFYEQVLDFDERPDLPTPNGVWDLGTAEAAEMTKLAETTYRDVNIALVNQFAKFAHEQEIDVYAVIAAANSQPYSHLHQPGVAVGGHCIPIYPRLYLWSDPDATVVRSARETNEAMPAYMVELLDNAAGGVADQRVVILGATYRGGVKETAFSGVFPVVEQLQKLGASVSVHDPLYTAEELCEFGWEPYVPGTESDLAILQAAHTEYQDWGPAQLPGLRVLLDGRRALDPTNWPGVDVVVLAGVRLSRSRPVPGV